MENARGVVFGRGEESPRVPAGQRPCSPGWLSSAPCRPCMPTEAEPPLCNKPSTPQLLEKSKFPPQTLRRDRKTRKPVTRLPLPIRWELGAGSGCQHQVTALPSALLGSFLDNTPCAAQASSLPSYATLPRMPGTDKKPCRHNTHIGGLSLRVSPSTPPA